MKRFVLFLLCALAACSTGRDAESDLVAIDVLLDPEPSMAAFAVAANERLRGNFPAGFTHANWRIAVLRENGRVLVQIGELHEIGDGARI